MERIKVGDVIRVMTYDRSSLGHGNGYKLVPYKFKVVKLYKHFALCKSIKSGVKECFSWWDLKQNIVKGEKHA